MCQMVIDVDASRILLVIDFKCEKNKTQNAYTFVNTTEAVDTVYSRC
jgi:hypothetical protein